MPDFPTLNSVRSAAESWVAVQPAPASPARHECGHEPRSIAGRPQYDEPALLAAALRGQLPAFNQLILHYQSLAYNIAFRLVGDRDTAEDALQDAFIKAYQRLGQYRGGSFKSWLLRIVTNSCYDALRVRRRRPAVPLDATEDEDDAEYDRRWIDRQELPDSYAVRQELAAAIDAAINRLPLDHRIVVILSDIEGLSYEEISQVTGMALGTVKSRLSRARAKMRFFLLQRHELLPAAYRSSEG